MANGVTEGNHRRNERALLVHQKGFLYCYPLRVESKRTCGD